jgi:hypothetical protein
LLSLIGVGLIFLLLYYHPGGWLSVGILLALAFLGTTIWGRIDRSLNPDKYYYAEHFLIERTFEARTPAGFAVTYWVSIYCKHIDRNDKTFYRIYDSGAKQTELAEEFRTQVLDVYLRDNCYVFRIPLRSPINDFKSSSLYPCEISRASKEGQTDSPQSISTDELKKELMSLPDFTKSGLIAKVYDFKMEGMTAEKIRENFRLMNENQLEGAVNDPQYLQQEERLAITMLKRALDFQEEQYTQTHETDWVTITAEKAGRGIKLSWKMRGGITGYELLGFRKSGDGFSPDQFNEGSNGALIIQSARSGSVTEFLKEGATYFYTFLWRSFSKPYTYYAGVRFQMTLIAEDERQLIDETIKRAEGKLKPAETPYTTNEQLARALNALGSFAEFEFLFDAGVKALAAKIEGAPYSPEEKSEKIARITDMAAIIREQYQE